MEIVVYFNREILQGITKCGEHSCTMLLCAFWIRQRLTAMYHTRHMSVCMLRAWFGERNETVLIRATPLLRHRDDIFKFPLLSISLYFFLFLVCLIFFLKLLTFPLEKTQLKLNFPFIKIPIFFQKQLNDFFF